MTHTLKSALKIATATAALTLLASSALAGDLSNGMPGGGMKDGRSAVPVPVPVPYEETYKYYVGAGFGWTFNSNGTMSITADHQMPGQPANWIDSYNQLQGPHVVSIVAGRYITPSIRAELGFDYRAPQRAAKQRTIAYDGRVTGALEVPHPVTGFPVQSQHTNIYSLTRTEDVSVQNHTFMLNGYYDFNREGRIKPYIGAGVGFTRRDVTRRTTEEVLACHSGSNSVNSTVTGCQHPGTLNSPLEPVGMIRDSYEEVTGFGLAAALMAGATYKLTERTHFELGYRMMYQGGKVAVMNQSLGGFSTLNVGDRFDHEIRTGMRFDIW